jgi:hypothetical protein
MVLLQQNLFLLIFFLTGIIRIRIRIRISISIGTGTGTGSSYEYERLSVARSSDIKPVGACPATFTFS